MDPALVGGVGGVRSHSHIPDGACASTLILVSVADTIW
jgi:hypothetical protein